MAISTKIHSFISPSGMRRHAEFNQLICMFQGEKKKFNQLDFMRPVHPKMKYANDSQSPRYLLNGRKFIGLVCPPKNTQKIEICKNPLFPLDVLNGGIFHRLVLPPKNPPKIEICKNPSFPLDVLNGGIFHRLVPLPKNPQKTKSVKIHHFHLVY